MRLQQRMAILPKLEQARSSLVRRIVRAKNDPGKRRVREWLRAIDDDKLLNFGLTQGDIAVLRHDRSAPR
jgi:hypothetical protein